MSEYGYYHAKASRSSQNATNAYLHNIHTYKASYADSNNKYIINNNRNIIGLYFLKLYYK